MNAELGETLGAEMCLSRFSVQKNGRTPGGITAGRSVDRGLRILFLLRKAPQAGINYTIGILATYPGRVKDDIM